jgi:hypothetical protein
MIFEFFFLPKAGGKGKKGLEETQEGSQTQGRH